MGFQLQSTSGYIFPYSSLEAVVHQEADCLHHIRNYRKTYIAALKNELEFLKEKIQKNLKEMVRQNRILLDDLWTRCCYSDDQRAAFRPYYVDYYSEEILNFHELEVEKLKDFYNKHKQVYQLAQSHKKLWDQFTHLEQEASEAARLFNNRDGKLLQEEKERKFIQQKLRAIRGELMALIIHYKATTGEDFLYFGAPLQEMLEHEEEQRDAIKENIEMQKTLKVANNENLLLESRLGTRLKSNRPKGKLQMPPLITRSRSTNIKMAYSTTSTASMKSTGSPTRGKKVSARRNTDKSIKNVCKNSTAINRALRNRNIC